MVLVVVVELVVVLLLVHLPMSATNPTHASHAPTHHPPTLPPNHHGHLTHPSPPTHTMGRRRFQLGRWCVRWWLRWW